MSRRSQSRSCDDLQTRLAAIANWQTATRDDQQVAKDLHQTRAVDKVHALNEAAFFDELFHYLREIGAWPLLEQLDPNHREGALYPFVRFVMFTIMRCVGGVQSRHQRYAGPFQSETTGGGTAWYWKNRGSGQSMLATHDLLLTDEALMGVLGFNAAQVQEGCTRRGLDRRTEPVEIRGPFSFDTVADNIVEIGAERGGRQKKRSGAGGWTGASTGSVTMW
jgi:hypothetical protein